MTTRHGCGRLATTSRSCAPWPSPWARSSQVLPGSSLSGGTPGSPQARFRCRRPSTSWSSRSSAASTGSREPGSVPAPRRKTGDDHTPRRAGIMVPRQGRQGAVPARPSAGVPPVDRRPRGCRHRSRLRLRARRRRRDVRRVHRGRAARADPAGGGGDRPARRPGPDRLRAAPAGRRRRGVVARRVGRGPGHLPQSARRGVWMAVWVIRWTGRSSLSRATSRVTKRWPLRSNSSTHDGACRRPARRRRSDAQQGHVGGHVDPRPEDDVAGEDGVGEAQQPAGVGDRGEERQATPGRRRGTTSPARRRRHRSIDPSTVPAAQGVGRRRGSFGGEGRCCRTRAIRLDRSARSPCAVAHTTPSVVDDLRDRGASPASLAVHRHDVSVVDGLGEARRDRPVTQPRRAPTAPSGRGSGRRRRRRPGTRPPRNPYVRATSSSWILFVDSVAVLYGLDQRTGSHDHPRVEDAGRVEGRASRGGERHVRRGRDAGGRYHRR